jgi:transcriptional regulator GlxA family with amidase domain
MREYMRANLTDNRPEFRSDEVWLALNRTLYGTVQRSRYAGQAPKIRQFIAARQRYPLADLRFVGTTLEILYANQGQARMSEIAEKCGFSLRQFERRFKQLTGLSPKLLARLIRFEAVRAALLYQPDGRLYKLASSFGYTDEAHFNHDFKILAGCSPGQFVAAAMARGASGIYLYPDPRPSVIFS